MPLLALLLIAAPAQPAPAAAPAPAADVSLTPRGTAGVSFFLPGGGSDSKLIGGTYFFSSDLAARVDLGLSVPIHPSGPGVNLLFSAGVGVRSYQLRHERAAVFLQPEVAIGREPSPAIPAEAALFLRLGGAIGVEYFFTSHFSAGATLELALKFANLAGPANNPVYTTLGTGTTGLSVNIYF